MILMGFLALFLSCMLPWIMPARRERKRNLLEPIFPVSLFFYSIFWTETVNDISWTA
jgi:hypothetical protein